MKAKRFEMKDEAFRCAHCGYEVKPNGVTSRDHCPRCLYSLHVDINPGDRANPCRGLLRPVSAVPHAKKGFQIVYRCEKCGLLHRNKAAMTGLDPDDTALLIELTAHPLEEI